MAPVELLLPSIWAAPKWSGAGWRLQGRRRRGGGPVPAREEAALGKPSNGTGVGASAGDAPAWRGNLGAGLAHSLGRS